MSCYSICVHREREHPPRFARPGTFEYEYSKRWKSLDEMEKQQRDQVEKNMREAREKLESEMEDAYHEHQANMLRQGASFKLLLDPQGFVNEDEGFLDHITKGWPFSYCFVLFVLADLLRRQEELRRMEEMHSQEMQKRKEMQIRYLC